MKKERKDEFQLKLEKETRKLQMENIKTVIFGFSVAMVIMVTAVAITEGIDGIIAYMKTYSFLQIFGCVIATFICWLLVKSICRRLAYDNIIDDLNKALVDKILIPNEPEEVLLVKSKDDKYRNFILSLQNEEKIKFYAVLGQDEMISIFAIFEGEMEKWKFDVVSKEEMLRDYQFVDS